MQLIKRLLPLVLLLIFFGCQTNEDSNCHFSNRKDVKTIENSYGRIVEKKSQIVISSLDELFVPCEIDDSKFNIGDSIIFSGRVKETQPNEKWIGFPIVLDKIEIIE